MVVGFGVYTTRVVAGHQVPPETLADHATWVKGQKEIVVPMLMTMEPDLQRNMETLGAYDTLKELKTLFAQQVKQELLQTVREFHACKQEEGQSVSSYVLKMKGYVSANIMNGLIGVQGNGNQNQIGNGNLVAVRAEGNAVGHNGNQIRLADLDEIKEVNANCILMANLQQASSSNTQTDSTPVYDSDGSAEQTLTSGTLTDKAPVYDSDGSAEVHKYENYYDSEIFDMFTQEEQYTELLEPIPEPHQVPQNDNNDISKVSSVEQSGGTVEQHPANVKETRKAPGVELSNNDRIGHWT
nr:zinc finger, CCHC-type [Tanacetum cinerariifolium]